MSWSSLGIGIWISSVNLWMTKNMFANWWRWKPWSITSGENCWKNPSTQRNIRSRRINSKRFKRTIEFCFGKSWRLFHEKKVFGIFVLIYLLEEAIPICFSFSKYLNRSLNKPLRKKQLLRITKENYLLQRRLK